MSSAKAARRAKFESVFNLIRDELVDHANKEGIPAEAVEWYRKNLEYNVPGGKLNRGMSVVDTVEILKGRPLTDDEYVKAAVLGWCVELLQAYFLIADDIMDGSITRRGQPCWYLSPSPALTTPSATPVVPATVPASLASQEVSITTPTYKHPPVGMTAINDAFMVESAIFRLLKVHFRSEACYLDLIELFHDITYKTEMGQLVDLVTAPEGVVDLARFSLERHRIIVTYKTAYYSFHLPVALAMHMCHLPESYTVKLAQESKTIRPYDLALSILIPLGEYFQIQDDFLDFSATPEVLGKIGTDIVDNKCSWCVNTVMAVCTPEQRLILDRNYGRKGDIEAGAKGADADKKADVEGEETEAGGLCEKRVKEVYEAVGLRKIYAEYEAGVYKRLNELIESIPEEGIIVDEKGQKVDVHNGLKRQVFRSFLEKIYGRSK
ncbi:Farnesyl pyrophosphate synthase [Hypsizygus marmoreus]|uniref:(2E,6E)-farnesyl diphosphate synthase n=1 Tax=Hypsizygus marmoreus TaxID=39966 RepID=A0A369K248_HYPMA|nr:Farnesyl pyrophosphate synthase [Hypsizygus marmoreus]